MFSKFVYKYLHLRNKWRSNIFIFFHNLHPDIEIGKKVTIGRKVRLRCEWGGKIKIGDNSILHDGVFLCTYGDDITLGKDCSINPYSIIYGQGKTSIGDHVLIAAHCMIVSQNHKFERNKNIRNSGSTQEGVVIEDNVWIAHGCSILDGVTIAKGTVIAAGSVLNQNTNEYSVWGGVPAKKIKNY